MKKYIIIPANQTEGMEGYSAIAIEVTLRNINDISRMFNVLDNVRKTDPTISKLIYDNPMLDIELLNDDFTPTDKICIQEIDNELFQEYLEEREYKVHTPSVEVSTFHLKIYYDAEYTNSQVYCEFTLEELDKLLTELE